MQAARDNMLKPGMKPLRRELPWHWHFFRRWRQRVQLLLRLGSAPAYLAVQHRKPLHGNSGQHQISRSWLAIWADWRLVQSVHLWFQRLLLRANWLLCLLENSLGGFLYSEEWKDSRNLHSLNMLRH